MIMQNSHTIMAQPMEMEGDDGSFGSSIPIAIIGIGCRFPGGAHDLTKFWEMLSEGKDCVVPVPKERWGQKHIHPNNSHKGRIAATSGGFLQFPVDQVCPSSILVSMDEQFDPTFFGISPREADDIDPQQRLLMEVAYEAIEEAGVTLDALEATSTGVYMGAMLTDWQCVKLKYPKFIGSHTATGSAYSILSNRLSFVFNLTGPSMTINTACSSSLVAMHVACQAIRSGECKMALAGGANLQLTPEASVMLSKGNFLAPDGRSKSFDITANGYGRGEGIGVLVLKPLADAERDGDLIHAVIRATGSNQDGHSMGLTVPNQQSQEKLMHQTLHFAGVRASDVGYIEAHGTGTPVGDPIEMRAISAVYGGKREGKRPLCAVGSVKSNFGHTEAAAGVAGVIKSVLILKRRQIPKVVHFTQTGEAIPLDKLQLRIPKKLQPYPVGEGLYQSAMAGINSFGFGGSNAHCLLEEYRKTTNVLPLPPPSTYFLPITARTPDSLRALVGKYAEWLDKEARELPLADICYTAAHRRTHHAFARVFAGKDHASLAQACREFAEAPKRQADRRALAPSDGRRLAVLFSGQGPQWWAMGRQLMAQQPVFLNVLKEVNGYLAECGSPWDLLEELHKDEEHSRMGETAVSQPAIFALQVGLYRLWSSWGIQPEAIVGHSVGEVAAAHCGGALTLKDATRVIYHRGRVQQMTSGHGTMYAVGLSQEEMEKHMAPYEGRVCIAAVNDPDSVTLSGDAEPLAELVKPLAERKVFVRQLKVKNAFHSHQMEPIKEELFKALGEVTVHKTTIPLFSTVTTEEEDGMHCVADYWWQNVRCPVLFAPTLVKMAKEGYNVFLEMSPHPVLGSNVAACLRKASVKGKALYSIRRKRGGNAPDMEHLAKNMGELFALGTKLDWNVLAPGRPVRGLPLYAWQHQRCWLEADAYARFRMIHSPWLLEGERMMTAYPHYELDVDHNQLEFLFDHIIQGSALVPAAGFCEMGMAAGCAHFGVDRCAVTSIHFRAPVILSEKNMPVLHVYIKPGTAKEAEFSIHFSTDKDMLQWTPVVDGKLIVADKVAPTKKTLDMAEIQQRCENQRAPADVYSELSALGLMYGPNFRAIETLWSTSGEACARIVLPEGLEETAGAFHIHPVLLDNSFQLMIGAMNQDGGKGDVFLPVGVERVMTFETTLPTKIDSYVKLDDLVSTDRITGNIVMADAETHAVVAEIRGLAVQRVGAQDAQFIGEPHLYEVEWREVSLAMELSGGLDEPTEEKEEEGEEGEKATAMSESSSSEEESDWEDPMVEAHVEQGGMWLVMQDSRGVGAAIAKEWSHGERKIVFVRPGKSYSSKDNVFVVRPEVAEDFENVLRTVDTSALRGVIALWALDAEPTVKTTSATLAKADTLANVSLVSLTTALVKANVLDGMRWLMVTAGVHRFNLPEDQLSVGQSGVWGLGRVIINEHPLASASLVDLDPRLDADVCAKHLIGEAEVTELNEREIMYRKGTEDATRFVARIVKGSLEGPADAVVALNPEEEEMKAFQPRPSVAVTQPSRVQPLEVFEVQIAKPGVIGSMELRQTIREAPGPEECEIEVKTCGLNFKDVLVALGVLTPLEATSGRASVHRFGLEGAGVVRRTGSKVTKFKDGDEVLIVGVNCMRPYALIDEQCVTLKPKHLTFEESATIPIVFLTAYYGLVHLGHMRKGESVLIHSATGGVGQAAIQFCKMWGAKIFATCSQKPEKIAMLKGMGIEHIYDSRSLKFATQIMEATDGRGVDLVLNSLAGEAIPASMGCLCNSGRFIDISRTDILKGEKINMRALMENNHYSAVELSRLIIGQKYVAGELFREMMELFYDKKLHPIEYRTFGVSRVTDAFTFMAKGMHMGKIVVQLAESRNSPKNLRGPTFVGGRAEEPPKKESLPVALPPSDISLPAFYSDATYIVTGGLGGFGFYVARWMAEWGARHLMLVGRSGAKTAEQRKLVTLLRARDIDVEVHKCDVSNLKDVQRVVSYIRKKMPPLRGIIHAAMVLDDGPVHDLNDERWKRVINPKVLGAWNLFQATRRDTLDFFVNFSSISAMLGNRGQANYASANGFLDYFSQHARAMGVPTVTVNWGALAEVGYVARHSTVGTLLSRVGVKAITPAAATDYLLRLLLRIRRVGQLGVFNVEWAQYRKVNPKIVSDARFSEMIEEIMGESTMGSGKEKHVVQGKVLALPDGVERRAAVQEFMASQIGSILGIPLARIDVQQPLNTMGLDSLMAMQLKSVLEDDMGIDLPITSFIQGPSVSQLTDELMTHLTRIEKELAEKEQKASTGGGAHKTGGKRKEKALQPVPLARLTSGDVPAEELTSGRHPLAHAQQALWFLWKMNRASAAYNLMFSCYMRSTIDIPLIRSIFQQIVDRHGSLRTTFGEASNGVPFAQVATPGSTDVSFEVVDARDFDEDHLRQAVADEGHAPFDLKNGPLFRVRLFTRERATDNILLLAGHHINLDVWSFGVMMEEFSVLFITKQQLPAPPAPYADYVADLAHRLTTQDGAAARRFWLRHLRGDLPALTLPTDRPRPPVQSSAGAIHHFIAPSRVMEGVVRLANETKSTTFSTLLGLYQLFLARMSGQDDILVGSPQACRHRGRDFHRTLGYFINTVVFRGKLGRDPTLARFLKRTGKTCADALAHQDYPFPLLVSELHPTRDASRSPLFQAMFVLERSHRKHRGGLGSFFFGDAGHRMSIGQLNIESAPLPQRVTQFDLTLIAVEHEDTSKGLAMSFQYSTDLFDPSTMERWSKQFVELLEAAVLPTAAELHVSAVGVGAAVPLAGPTVPAGPLPLDAIEAMCTKHPTKVAVEMDPSGATLTCQALWSKAEKMGQALVASGVSPGAVVAVAVERSLEMVAALVGVWMAKAAFLPLDVTAPQDRLAFMLKDANVAVVVADQVGLAALPRSGVPTIVGLEVMGEEDEEASSSGKRRKVKKGSARGKRPGGSVRGGKRVKTSVAVDGEPTAAYVLYTSGSTGTPKGVLVEHVALANRLHWMAKEYEVSNKDRVLHKTPLTFDVSLWEVFLPLVAGGRVVVAKPQGHRDPSYIADVLVQRKITISHFVPSLLAQVVRLPNMGRAHQLRHVVCSGEALGAELRDGFYQAHSKAVLSNLYGPTEAAIDVTFHRVARDDHRGYVPIGMPVDNTRLYILDRQGHPVLEGGAGELWIAGVQLARGYVQREDLTASTFVVKEPERMYRSGDLVRRVADGLHFLGRVDHQVKLRGQRLELGEVEAALRKVTGVRHAVARVVQGPGGKEDIRLVGYVTSVADLGEHSAPFAVTVREDVTRVLPPWAVPAVVVVLKELPRLNSGKVNRRALPMPEWDAGEDVMEDDASLSPVELQLRSIWCKVLGRHKVSVHSDFFALGGHSLLVTRLLAEVEGQLGVKLPLARVFETPTIHALARRMEAGTLGEEVEKPDLPALAAEALPKEVRPHKSAVPTTGAVHSVFVTGATGFLGAYSLSELMHSLDGTVHCLVRASSAEKGWTRVEENMQRYGLWSEKWRGRVRVYVGMLDAPYFGLSEAMLDTIVSEVDALVHIGANVNFVYPYATLASANVGGTVEMVRLACRGMRVLPLHHISTLGVLPPSTSKKTYKEDHAPSPAALEGGYNQSKWVAEQVVEEAHRRGVPCTIYRPGRVTGESKTGRWTGGDFTLAMLRGCTQLGCYPALGKDAKIDITPVDWVAKSLVALVCQGTPTSMVHRHLVCSHAIPFAQLMEWVEEASGVSLQKVEYMEWRKVLLSAKPGENALWPLLPLFSGTTIPSAAFFPTFETKDTVRALRQAGEKGFDAPTPALIGLYVQFLQKDGQMPEASVEKVSKKHVLEEEEEAPKAAPASPQKGKRGARGGRGKGKRRRK